MKLNKKGFGVAEMAIVILLIGILAAAVIVGFLGIKKNANEHVKEEATKSIEIINQTKHAYPTILSSDLENGLKIKEGEYEVYELGGYKILDGATGVSPIYVEAGGTLYVSGNGTLDNTSKIDGTAQPTIAAVVNYGELTLSDLIISGGNKNVGTLAYAFACYGKSITTLNNVKLVGGTAVTYVSGSTKLYINGVNTRIVLPYESCKSGRNLFYIYGNNTIEINDGTFSVEDQHNTYFYITGASTVTINGGQFVDRDNTTVDNYRIFGLANGAKLNINGGFFNATVCDCNKYGMFHFAGDATVIITGGEFKKEPARFASGVDKNTKILEITDAPNDGTEQLIFHYAPNVGEDGGWGQYVADDYEIYDLDTENSWDKLSDAEKAAVKTWGVRPKTS